MPGGVGGAQALEKIAGDGEAGAAARAFEERVVHQPVEQREVVAFQIGVVVGELRVVAGAPHRIDRNAPRAEQARIELALMSAEAAVGIVADAALQPHAAVLPAFAILAGDDVAAAGGDDRGDRGVARRPTAKCRRQAQEVADIGRIADIGRQDAAGIAHGGIGFAQIGRIEQRHAEEFEPGIVEDDAVLELVVAHMLRADLPDRCALAGLVADLAGRIAGVERLDEAALAARGAGRDHAAVLADQRREAPERAVAHLVAQVDMVGEGDVSSLVGQADMAARRHRVVRLVVGDLVGEQDAARPAVDLDMAAGGDDMGVDVVVHLVGLEQHVALDRQRRRGGGRRGRKRRQCRDEDEAARRDHPSSWLKTRVMPIRIAAVAGAPAASATGRMPVWPSARANSLRNRCRSRTGADQNDAEHPAAAPQPNRKARRHEHHRGEQRGHREQGVEIELVAHRRESRALRRVDEARELPEGQRIGRREALLDLHGRQRRGEVVVA